MRRATQPLFARVAALVAALATTGGAALAAPPAAGDANSSKAPARDEVVATQLLPRSVKASLRQQAGSEASLAPVQRLALAQRMIEAGRASGDPRTLGYAEALLAPLFANPPVAAKDTPLDALVLRATIEGSRHRFDASRELLDRVLAREPQHAQALLTRATISQVTGDYSSARSDCQRLRPLSAEAAAICTASVDALTGANERALATLRFAAERTTGALKGWSLALQAQLLEAGGDSRAAANAYRASLLAADDLVTRLAYADLLLASKQPAAADELLKAAPETDGVLVRRWLIARALKGDVASLEERLQSRFAAAAARGELLHAREAALFALERGDSAAALKLAQDNWRAQREPADLWLLARAARAAGDNTTLGEARAWVARTGLIDARFTPSLRGG